jgi:hypothetical protein
MTIKDFGTRVANIWAGLRPTTRKLVEAALQSAISSTPTRTPIPYDARAERELSLLLKALEERTVEAGLTMNAEQARELKRMADTCALILHEQACSAESFAQLIERALRLNDYARIDLLADLIAKRLPPSEVCELVRHDNPIVRALAHETLTQIPTVTLIGLLSDPFDAEIARYALRSQAEEYNSEEARWITTILDRAEEYDNE